MMNQMGVMATYFSKKRSFAMGVASTGNSAGGMIYPVIVRELLPKIGFAWTVRVLGFMNLALLSIVVTFMKPRLPPRKSDALIDWSAFRELPFSLYCIAMYLQVWDIYYTLYYVSISCFE
jgi:predicted membrane-bound spermidine synthase